MSDDLRFTSTVVGTEALKQRFLSLNDTVRSRLRTTLVAIGEQLRARMAADAPRKTGALASSIRSGLSEDGASMTETVRPTKFYARFMEYGVVNHGTNRNARSVSKADLKTKNKRRALVDRVRELRSSGAYRIKPHPFVGPAWDAMHAQAEAQIEAALADALKET